MVDASERLLRSEYDDVRCDRDAAVKGVVLDCIRGNKVVVGCPSVVTYENAARVLFNQIFGNGGMIHAAQVNSFAAIEDELRSQYVVSYRPANFDADGRYRSIEITALKKDLQVRARKGYYAPRQ